MTSADLKRFYELYYGRRFRINKFSVRMSIESGYRTEIELSKNGEREVIKSDEEDVARVLQRFQNVTDSDGAMRLDRITDPRKYFAAVEELAENRESKVSGAIHDLETGKSPLEPGFWHDVDRALVKLLFENTSPDDPDILWLRENYFHIFASNLVETRDVGFFGERELLQKHRAIQKLARLAESILQEGFLPDQEKQNPVEIYKTYRQHLPDSLEDHSERVAIQLAYLRDLRAMIEEGGSQDENVRILYVLDVYRRVYELARPILDLLRIAISLTKGETPEPQARDSRIVSVLTENGYKRLVDAFNPQIRHCESHLATRIREGKRAVLLTKPKGLRRVTVQELSYEEIVDYQERLFAVVLPALYYAWTSFDGFLKILLMDSLEYQLLMISRTAGN